MICVNRRHNKQQQQQKAIFHTLIAKQKTKQYKEQSKKKSVNNTKWNENIYISSWAGVAAARLPNAMKSKCYNCVTLFKSTFNHTFECSHRLRRTCNICVVCYCSDFVSFQLQSLLITVIIKYDGPRVQSTQKPIINGSYLLTISTEHSTFSKERKLQYYSFGY